jgi:TPP-dependent pyruvate/acetoin dehydrogenase alpha subunit
VAEETAVAPTGKKGVKREDPPARPVEQIANRGFLEGHDPGKHYVWVSEVNDPTINVGYYKHLGYQVAQYDPSEARPTIGYQEYKQGDPIKSMGMVLMECPLERKAELDKVGWDRAARIEDTIRNREVDPLSDEEKRAFRGITSVRTEQDDRRKWQF